MTNQPFLRRPGHENPIPPGTTMREWEKRRQAEAEQLSQVGMPSSFDESLLAVLERIATALETIAERERL
jgi:hypothetical protein